MLCVLCCRAWERRAVPIKLIGGEELTVYRWVTDTPRQLSRKAEFTRSPTWSMTRRHLHYSCPHQTAFSPPHPTTSALDGPASDPTFDPQRQSHALDDDLNRMPCDEMLHVRI